MIEEEVEVINKMGLHARAAAKLVQLTNRFKSDIIISLNDLQINGKSIMGIMLLAATKGTKLNISINGDDAEEMMKSIKELFENKFGEEE
ncbi:MAG TPA: HPr family phosphocarrier protein [bacterium]|nr:HPr family phosphocarrier protein [bacterium]HOL48411.1 HPr family phosphocarrier protein [bacterium]HPQ18148.1 HPr family phosphocarrier protein [bacterium]